MEHLAPEIPSAAAHFDLLFAASLGDTALAIFSRSFHSFLMGRVVYYDHYEKARRLD